MRDRGKSGLIIGALILIGLLIAADPAFAARLELDETAPQWAKLGADIILYAHIGGGTIGILTGVIAITSRKGSPVHRAAGKLFFVSMFVAYAIGAGVAPFLHTNQRPNFVGGVLALYLLITAFRTVRIPRIKPGAFEYGGLLTALAITGAGFLFMQMAANSPTGTIDDSPSEAFVLFATAGIFAVLGDLHLIFSKGLTGAARIARHLWRMCFSFFIAATSLFLGQPQVFPEWFNASPAPFVLSFAPLIALLVWMVITGLERVRGGQRE